MHTEAAGLLHKEEQCKRKSTEAKYQIADFVQEIIKF